MGGQVHNCPARAGLHNGQLGDRPCSYPLPCNARKRPMPQPLSCLMGSRVAASNNAST